MNARLFHRRYSRDPRVWRLGLVTCLLAAAALGLLGRAVYLQVVDNDYLRGQGDDRYLRVMKVPAYRGMIVDRNGEPLAVSSPVDSVWAEPAKLLEQRHRIPELADQLSLEAATLEALIAQRADKRFVYLRRHLEPQHARRVMALKIPGVQLLREYRRYYPTAEVTASLLGFTDIDDAGQEGLELAFENWLRAIPGGKRIIQDRLGNAVEDVESINPRQPGKTLTLSIDRRIQYLAYRSLKAAVLEHKASAASAVVLDVTTGEILAMVNQPAVNPNDRGRLAPAKLRNRAVTDLFEPGSTLKPFSVAMGLESGAYTPTTRVDTKPGHMRVGRHMVRDVHNYGLLNVSRVITKSSNVGVSKIALSLPPEQLWNLYSQLGFGELSGVGLVGEQAGHLSHYSGWSQFEYATHAFGYGVSVNALQLARAYAVLAADGVRRPLSLLRRAQAPAEGERVLSVATARQVRAMMETVVSTEGTASKAAVPGHRVAGKTGTVHKIVNGRYAKDRYYSVFAGLAPVDRPRLVMVVVVDDPKGKVYYGGQVAAPVFSRVMSGALRLLNVAPDAVPAGAVQLAGGPQ